MAFLPQTTFKGINSKVDGGVGQLRQASKVPNFASAEPDILTYYCHCFFPVETMVT